MQGVEQSRKQLGERRKKLRRQDLQKTRRNKAIREQTSWEAEGNWNRAWNHAEVVKERFLNRHYRLLPRELFFHVVGMLDRCGPILGDPDVAEHVNSKVLECVEYFMFRPTW
jgi:hypothetical protein